MEDGGSVGQEGGAEASSEGAPWVTLCQVGRALLLLSDLAVLAFLLALALYYTMVVLDRPLSFRRLAALFLLGLAAPVALVAAYLLLQALLLHAPDDGALGAASSVSSACTLDALGGWLHWAVTAPKLLALLLALCLVSVATYGFWRLHAPQRPRQPHSARPRVAPPPDYEAAYGRQGVLRALALLLALAQAELLWLVAQYQRLHAPPGLWHHPHPDSPPPSSASSASWSVYLVHAATAACGTKGCLLALLLCFLDREVTHATCCPPRGDPDPRCPPWASSPSSSDRSPGGAGGRGTLGERGSGGSGLAGGFGGGDLEMDEMPRLINYSRPPVANNALPYYQYSGGRA